MLDVMMGVPPIPHEATAISSDAVTLWVTIGIMVALVVVVTFILGVAEYRSLQRQSQMKEAELHEAEYPEPQRGEQPPVHAPEEEKILLRR